MNSILIPAAPAHFLAGLALITLAAMICAALGRASWRPTVAWGLIATIALALAEWCDLAAVSMSRPAAWQLARLALEIVALAGLIELGRLCTTGRRAGLLPRWSYPVVGVLALAAVLLAWFGVLELVLRLATLWQAGWLAASYFTRSRTSSVGIAGETTIPAIEPGTLSARVILGALLVYLVAATVAMPLVGVLAAFVAVVAAWLAFGPSHDQSRQSKLLWRSAWPVGFALIAGGGCFALPTAGINDDGLLLVESVAPADGDLADADLSGPAADDDMAVEGEMSAESEKAAASREFVRQAKRIGLGISPIILFVLLVWGLSRLPFVH